MTLNGVMAIFLRYFAEFAAAFGADYVKVVEATPYFLRKKYIA